MKKANSPASPARLVIQHDRDGMVFFFREGQEQFETGDAQRIADGLNPITLESLDNECRVKPGHYLLISLP